MIVLTPFRQHSHPHSQDLKKPLRVTFIGAEGVAEEGLDEGGVSREFFQLLVSQGLYIKRQSGQGIPVWERIRVRGAGCWVVGTV